MKKIFKYTGASLMAMALLSACTGNFEDFNTNPKGLSDEETKQANNYVGMHYVNLQKAIYYDGSSSWEYQLIQNLNADIWSGFIASATAFAGNISNITYALTADWNDNCWNYAYNNVMAQNVRIDEKCAETEDSSMDHYKAINQILRVVNMSRLTDQYGCVIYSHYGESALGGIYDSGQDAYKLMFQELTEAANALHETVNRGEWASFKAFDLAYQGDITNWARLANSLRLRLAIRIAKYDPAWAKSEGEAALADPMGLIESNDQNFQISGKNYGHPLYGVCYGYNDSHLNADIPAILGGMGDARLEKLATKNEEGVVFGIRSGIKGQELKDEKTGVKYQDMYKEIISYPNLGNDTPGMLMSAAETILLEAEASLRGWDVKGRGTTKDLYERGIRTSFEFWGANIGDYLESTKTPLGYTDPIIPTASIGPQSTVCPKWEEGVSAEEKLEKIVTQRWIAIFPEGMNGWAEVRRTGYPKLFPIMDEANASQGVISTRLGVRRLPFTVDEHGNNAANVEEAIRLLGGPDNGATRVFWDVDGPNI